MLDRCKKHGEVMSKYSDDYHDYIFKDG
jgi:hypothetical protein